MHSGALTVISGRRSFLGASVTTTLLIPEVKGPTFIFALEPMDRRLEDRGQEPGHASGQSLSCVPGSVLCPTQREGARWTREASKMGSC